MNLLNRIGVFSYVFKPTPELLRSAALAVFAAGSQVAFTGDPHTLEGWHIYGVAIGVGVLHALFMLVFGKKPAGAAP